MDGWTTFSFPFGARCNLACDLVLLLLVQGVYWPWGHRQLFGCGQKAWCHPGWCWWSFFCSQAVRGPAVFLNSISPRFAPSYNDAVGLTKTNWWKMTGFFWCQEFRGKNPRSEQNWEKNGSFDITYQPPWNINSTISSPKFQLQVARLQYDGRLAGPSKNGFGMMICWVGSPVMFFFPRRGTFCWFQWPSKLLAHPNFHSKKLSFIQMGCPYIHLDLTESHHLLLAAWGDSWSLERCSKSWTKVTLHDREGPFMAGWGPLGIWGPLSRWTSPKGALFKGIYTQ